MVVRKGYRYVSGGWSGSVSLMSGETPDWVKYLDVFVFVKIKQTDLEFPNPRIRISTQDLTGVRRL